MTREETLIRRIRTCAAAVVVIGLRYVGPPLAAKEAKAGHAAIGIERRADRVDRISRGENYIGDVVTEDAEDVVGSDCLRASQGFAVVAEDDVVTFHASMSLDRSKQSDTSHIEHIVDQSLPWHHVRQLLVPESTMSHLGVTEEITRPRLGELPEDVASASECLRATDLVLGATGHAAVDYRFVVQHAPVVFDARNATSEFDTENVIRLGVE